MKLRASLCVLVSLLLAEPLLAAGNNYSNYRCRPVGTWLINIEFPGVPTPISKSLQFQQLLVLNADRTLQETNTGLHPNATPLTAPLPPPDAPFAPPPLTGSDGFGSWKWKRGCRVKFSFIKFLFAGDSGMPDGAMGMPNSAMSNGPPPPPPAGVPIGFLKVSGVARIVGSHYSSDLGDVKSEIIIGSHPMDPDALRIDAGESIATGMRLLPTD